MADMPEPTALAHCQRIRKRYQRAPTGPMAPVASGRLSYDPDENRATGGYESGGPGGEAPLTRHDVDVATAYQRAYRAEHGKDCTWEEAEKYARAQRKNANANGGGAAN